MAKAHFGGPLAGGYMALGVSCDAMLTNTVRTFKVAIPAGMDFTVLGVSYGAGTVGSDPAVEVGTAADPNGILTAANITTVAQYAVPNGALASGSAVTLDSGATSNIEVVVTADTGDSLSNLSVHIFGFVSQHPTNTGPNLAGRESIENGGR